jgi:hypothetical protein
VIGVRELGRYRWNQGFYRAKHQCCELITCFENCITRDLDICGKHSAEWGCGGERGMREAVRGVVVVYFGGVFLDQRC